MSTDWLFLNKRMEVFLSIDGINSVSQIAKKTKITHRSAFDLYNEFAECGLVSKREGRTSPKLTEKGRKVQQMLQNLTNCLNSKM